MATIPESDNVVRVKLVDTTTAMVGDNAAFVKPVVAGHEVINFCSLAFLLENERLGKKAMFDLGVRKDYWNLPKAILQLIGKDCVIFGMRVDNGIDEVLKAGGVELNTIDYCIWSHAHFDHRGDVSLFPKSTSLVVGPGYLSDKERHGGVGDPAAAAEFEGRPLKEADFDGGLKIGKFRAQDFFGDGSFYLLDAPGHQPEHICALARTTPSSAPGGATFVFLGGDICHFAGVFRPTPTTPLPEEIPASAISNRNDWASRSVCPCSFFTPHHPRAKDDDSARTSSWYNLPSTGHVYTDLEKAANSVSKMSELDTRDDVMVCLGHDASLLDVLPVFNKNPEKDINDWKKEGWKATTYWSWLNEVAVDGKKPREPVVDGFWKDGKPWDFEGHKAGL
ncbi:metallo-beta-lactamase superfamily protein [Colletotrichum karsti]|uniref:Metallo-beta-lactamase superfamily protein n=1 Tax=Colletotrichum karsti TaxID=1095194 RepID=A0A9P6LR22_9PEZI|nr:metallo-beta-lactamase superfamily protein [Colletotrichum karsti]KAF9881687.1 metallo-beta-lactamase superfamily protein [Colletotrichum karsti]